MMSIKLYLILLFTLVTIAPLSVYAKKYNGPLSIDVSGKALNFKYNFSPLVATIKSPTVNKKIFLKKCNQDYYRQSAYQAYKVLVRAVKKNKSKKIVVSEPYSYVHFVINDIKGVAKRGTPEWGALFQLWKSLKSYDLVEDELCLN